MSIMYRVTHKPTGEQWLVQARDEVEARAYVFAHMGYINEYRGDTLNVMIEA